jgi:hypothetical protein
VPGGFPGTEARFPVIMVVTACIAMLTMLARWLNATQLWVTELDR